MKELETGIAALLTRNAGPIDWWVNWEANHEQLYPHDSRAHPVEV